MITSLPNSLITQLPDCQILIRSGSKVWLFTGTKGFLTVTALQLLAITLNVSVFVPFCLSFHQKTFFCNKTETLHIQQTFILRPHTLYLPEVFVRRCSGEPARSNTSE